MQRIFVGCLPGDTNSKDLAKILSKYARLKKVSLVLEDTTPDRVYCKGYGFAICHNREEAAKLVAQDGKITYKNRVLALSEFKSGSKLSKDRALFIKRRVFVGNISTHGDESSLKRLLERFVAVEKIFFVRSDKTSNGMFGYAVFGSAEDAEKLLRSGEVIKYKGRKLRFEQFIPEETSEVGQLASSGKKQAKTPQFGQHIEGLSFKAQENRPAGSLQSAGSPRTNPQIHPLDSNSSQQQLFASLPKSNLSKPLLQPSKEEITQQKKNRFTSFSKKIASIVRQNHFHTNIRINIGLQSHPNALHSICVEQVNQPTGWQGFSETIEISTWRQIDQDWN